MPRRRAVQLLGILAVVTAGAAGALLLYFPTLGYGFHYDDYAFIRPYSRGEVIASFFGSWDHSGIMVPFYRPLTVVMHWARFEAFGLNAVAHHWAGLIVFALCGALSGVAARQMSGASLAGVLAALFFVTHPAMTYGQAVWITNQMHLLESLIVLTALIWWHAVARRGGAWWLPLLVLGAAAFLVKEDGIMLLPAILALHWLRRRIAEPDLPAAPRSVVVAAAVLVCAMVLIRQQALGQLGGYGPPTLERAWQHFSAGLIRVFRLVPADRPWQPAASWFATLLPLAGVVAWPRASPRARFVLAAGAAVALAFNAPFIFVTKVEQMHLVALGAVLVLTGSAWTIVTALRSRALQAGALAVALAGVLLFALVARDISTDFEPYGPIVRHQDRGVQGWAAVAADLREYLRLKTAPETAGRISPNPVDVVRSVAFGFHPPETSAQGIVYRWMSQPRAEIHVMSSARSIVIPIRHDAGAFQEPTRAVIESDGTRIDSLDLRDAEWHVSQVPFRSRDLPLFARMHRIVIAIPHAWVPARTIPGSNDERTLGLQIGALEIR